MLENRQCRAYIFCYFWFCLTVAILSFFIRLKPLEAIACSSLCAEKQGVLLIFDLFSWLLHPLKRFRVAFSLLCMKKTFFYSCCLFRVASASCVWRSKAFHLYLICFSSLLTPLKRFRVAFSLLCVKKTFFILVVCCVWLSASCVWRSKAFYLFLICFSSL